MSMPLRILLIEDSDDDATLLVRELRRGGYAPEWRRVDTPAGLEAALDEAEWDALTCDWVMPHFSAPAALQLLRKRGCDLPTLIVSGEVGEEVAVSAMKSGAHDFVSKHRLTRLVPAIERELRESAERRALRRAEATLRQTQERLRAFIEQASDLIFTLDGEGRVTSVNAAVSDAIGYQPEELLGRSALDLVAPHHRARSAAALQRLHAGEPGEGFEFEVLHKHGEPRVLEIRGHTLRQDGAQLESFHIARDITERRRREAERARLSAALEQAPEPIAITDAHDTIIYLNPAGERLTGFSRADAGQPSARIRRQDSRLVRLAVTVSPIRDADGRIVDYVGRPTKADESLPR